jgi:uncharacterized membrane protein
MNSLTLKLFSLDAVYVLTGAVLLSFAVLTWRDASNQKRHTSALFWFVLAVIFALGSVMPHWLTGLLVVLMVVLDGANRVGKGEARESSTTNSLGAKIFLPVILIPAVTVLIALVFRGLGQDANRGALVGLGFGGVAAMCYCVYLTRSKLTDALDEGRRLNETMGAVNILPQLLASLGVIFATAKVGDLIAAGIQSVIAPESLFLLVLANCAGMALFTIVMGNSFAAFPVLAAGVLVPLLIKPFHIDPAMAAIITLTAGASGTLLTPMAANFNIVPAALLNLKDQYGVIRFQWPYAVAMWSLHVLLLWLFIKFTN